MQDYHEILDRIPVEQLAHQVGEPPVEVEAAIRNALPALLMGLDANAQDPAGEASIMSALGDHDPNLLQDDAPLSRVDPHAGAKITHHIFGSNEDAVMAQLGGLGGGDSLIRKLMPMLAPIVMSWLAGKLRQGHSSQGGGLGDILGQALGSGNKTPQSTPPRQPTGRPRFRQPSKPLDTDTGAPQMRLPEGDPLPETQQTNQPGGGGLGGGVLGQILGDLLGGGRR